MLYKFKLYQINYKLMHSHVVFLERYVNLRPFR